MTRILAAILLAFASVLSCQTTSHSDIIEQVMPDGAPAQMRKLTRAEEVSAVLSFALRNLQQRESVPNR
jgi:hypothetical protein